MPYHVAICDDSVNDAEFVKTILLSWANERMHEVRADVFPSAESFSLSMTKTSAMADAIINKQGLAGKIKGYRCEHRRPHSHKAQDERA